MKIRSSILTIAAFTIAIGSTSTFFAGGVANALLPEQVARPDVEARVAERAQTAEQRLQERDARAEERIQQREARTEQRLVKLDAVKLRVCEKRQDVITSIMKNIAERGSAQVAVFDKIADRTKEFYAAKGYNIPEYATLAAEVDAKHDAALAASSTTKSLSESWTCAMNDPKANITALREAKTAEVAALKEYKTSIRNLIVAVKSASSTAEATTESTATSTTGEAQ